MKKEQQLELNETLENLRVSYRHHSLDITDCEKDPFKQFDQWMVEAVKGQCDEPNAFVLATVTQDRPRARVVLLKGLHNNQFVFYTNYLSAKGHEIEKNPYACMTFLWLPLQRQIRIEGKLTKVAPSLSDDYFQKRPRGSQIGAIASPQSQKVQSRDELEKLFKNMNDKFEGIDKLERPAHWGGYALSPDYMEFWQGRDNRMHDRIVYEKLDGLWKLGRLAP